MSVGKNSGWSVDHLVNRRGKYVLNDTNRLLVWQKSHMLVLKIYRVTKCFPKEEHLGLTSQESCYINTKQYRGRQGERLA